MSISSNALHLLFTCFSKISVLGNEHLIAVSCSVLPTAELCNRSIRRLTDRVHLQVFNYSVFQPPSGLQLLTCNSLVILFLLLLLLLRFYMSGFAFYHVHPFLLSFSSLTVEQRCEFPQFLCEEHYMLPFPKENKTIFG